MTRTMPAVFEPYRKFAAHRIGGTSRQKHPARIGQSFDACRDVHPVAVNVVAVNNHVAHIDSYAEFDLRFVNKAFVALGDQILDFKRTTDSVYGACKLHQAVANEFDDASGMLCGWGIDEIAPDGFEPRQRSRLVGRHELRVAHDVHCKDRRQFPLQAPFRYQLLLRSGRAPVGSRPSA